MLVHSQFYRLAQALGDPCAATSADVRTTIEVRLITCPGCQSAAARSYVGAAPVPPAHTDTVLLAEDAPLW